MAWYWQRVVPLLSAAGQKPSRSIFLQCCEIGCAKAPRRGDEPDQLWKLKRRRYGAGDLLSVPAPTRDGRRVSVEFTVTVLLDERGGVAGVAAVMCDVTGRFDEMKVSPPQGRGS
jgi:hypothetical protein